MHREKFIVPATCLAALLLAACGVRQAPPADAAALYRRDMVGRWSEGPGCAGMVWDFRETEIYAPNGFDAPGGVHCPALRVSESPDADARILASNCDRGAMLHGDLVLDLTLSGNGPDETLTIAGVFAPVQVRQWRRCAAAADAREE